MFGKFRSKKPRSRIFNILKYSLISIATFIISLPVLIILALFVANFISLNPFKDDIQKAASDAGIHLKLNGDISHRVLYPIYLSLNDVHVYESPGNTTQEFVAVKNITLEVSPIALIYKVLKIDNITIDTLTVHNKNYADGTNTISRFLDGMNAKSSNTPKKGEDNTGDSFDIFSYNVDVDRLELKNIAYHDASSQKKLALTNVSLNAKNLNLDTVNRINLEFHTIFERKNASDIKYDATALLEFKLDRQTQVLNVSEFDYKSKLTLDPFKDQPINLNTKLTFDIKNLSLKIPELVLDVSNLVVANASADANLKDQITADFNLKLLTPRIQNLTSKFIKADTSKSPDVPFNFSVKGTFKNENITISELLLQLGATQLKSQKLMYALKDALYEAQLTLDSEDNKTVTDHIGVRVLRRNIPISLDVSAKGNVTKILHDLKAKLTAGKLNINIAVDSDSQPNQDIQLNARVKASSPNITREVDAVKTTNEMEAIPFQSVLETDILIGNSDLSVSRFLFDLNRVISITADGIVKNYNTSPVYSFNVKNSSKDLKRIIALFTGNQVKFQKDSLENINLSARIVGDKKQIAVSRFNLSNRDVLLNGNTSIIFSPLTVNADFLGKRLNIDPFIPLPQPDDKLPPAKKAAITSANSNPDGLKKENTQKENAEFLKVTPEGNMVLSKESIEKYVSLPDADIKANLILNNIRYGNFPDFNLHTNVDTQRKQKADVRLLIKQKPFHDASVRFNITKNNDNALKIASDIDVNLNFKDFQIKELPVKNGRVDFKSALRTTGNSPDELFRNIDLNATFNTADIQLRDPSMPKVDLNGQFELVLRNMKLGIALKHINLESDKPNNSKEQFHGKIGLVAVKADISKILQQNFAVNSVVIEDTDVELFQNKQGFLGLAPKENPTSTVPPNTITPKPSAKKGGYGLKYISLKGLTIKNTALVFNDLVNDDSQHVNLAGLSLEGAGIKVADQVVRTNSTTLNLQSLTYKNKSQSAEIPKLMVDLSEFLLNPKTQYVKVGSLSIALPKLSAVNAKQTLANTDLVFGINNMDAYYPTGQTGKKNRLDVKFDKVSLSNNQLLIDSPQEKYRINVDDLSLNIESPKSLKDINLQFTVNLEHTDMSTDTGNLIKFLAGGGISLDLAKKRYATDIKLDTKANLNMLQNKSHSVQAVLNVMFDQEQSQVTINEISISGDDLMKLLLTGKANISPERLSADGKLQASVYDLNDIMRLTGAANRPDNEKIPIEIDLGISTVAGNAGNKITIKSKQMAVSRYPIMLDAFGLFNISRNLYLGELNISIPELKKIVELITAKPIDSAKPDILKDFQIQGRVSAKDDKLTLKRFDISFDETLIHTAGFRDLKSEKTTLSVDVNKINLDHYLPPRKEAVEEEEKKDSDEKGEPIQYSKKELIDAKTRQALTALDISADVTIANLTVRDIHFDKIGLSALAQEGVMQIKPFKIEQKDGVIEANAKLDLQPEIPAYAYDLSVKQFDIGNVAEPIMKKEMITGIVNASLDGNSDANSVHGLISNLNGRIYLNVSNAVYRGFNVDYYTCIGLSAISLDIVDQADFPEDTYIDNVAIEGFIEKGHLVLYDIFSDLKTIHMTAAGDFHMITQLFDLNAYMNITETKENNCKIRGELKKYVLKTRCEGKTYDFGDLNCAPDYAALGGLVYKGVAGRVNEAMAHYQKQIDNYAYIITTPLSAIRTFVVDFFNFIGAVISGDASKSLEQNSESVFNQHGLSDKNFEHQPA